MNFIDAVKNVFTNYANFNGRARRSEYWWFALFGFIVSWILFFIDGPKSSAYTETGSVGIQIGTLGTIYALATLLPNLAVTVRRLHDVGKSGWFFLIIFIPLVGVIWLIVL